MKSERFEGIQALRGLAVLLVIWTHMKFTGNFSQVPWIENHIGGVGVDIFFVISGFVICISAKSLDFNASAFFLNRFTRIAPMYWLTAIPVIFVEISKHGFDKWNSILSTFTFLPFFDFHHYTPPINNFGWSLAYEMFFYIAFSLALIASRHLAWVAVIIALAAGSALMSLWPEVPYLLPKFIFNPMIFEFVVGILIYTARNHIGLKSLLISIAGSIFFAYQLTQFGHPGNFIEDYRIAVHRLIVFGGFGTCLVIIAVAIDKLKILRWPKITQQLGEYSYSIYLIQFYTLWLCTNLWKKFHINSWVSASLFLVLSIILGGLLSHLFEKQLTQYTRRLFSR